MIKQCIKPNCRKEYRVCDEGFGLDNCRVCGAPLKVIKEENDFNGENEEFSELNQTMILGNDSSYLEEEELQETQKINLDFEENQIDETSILHYDLDETAFIPRESLEVQKNINKSDGFFIDEFGYIYFDRFKETINNYPKIVIYLEDIVYKVIDVKYEEMTIGRSAKNNNPDIDLKAIDLEKIISRKHGIIYKKNDGYYLKNIASQNSIHINGVELFRNQEKKLESDDLIILSRKFKLEYIINY